MGRRVREDPETGRRTRVARRDLADTRRKVITAINNGMHPDMAAEVFECGRSTVYGWMKSHRISGEDAFEVRKPSGRPTLLTKRQMDRLRAWIVGKDPRQLRFEFALWTRELVRQLIEREFGVAMTRQTVGRLLRRLGLSPQRPLVRAYQQDPERVERWKQVEYPEIRDRAQQLGAQIFFADEAGVRSDYHSGTTWGEVGHTPIVRGSGGRVSLNMISAVSTTGKLHFTFAQGKVNAEVYIEYLKKLLHDVEGPVFLIVDGHPSHKAKKVKEFVASTEGRLELFFLPPYSPELNPDEWVWKNVKHDHVGKMAVHSVEVMRAAIEAAVARLVDSTEIVLGFFRDPDLRYIGVAGSGIPKVQ